MTVEEELFLQQILEERDRLFRETSKLKSQLISFQNFDTEKASYEKLLIEKDQTIIKLKQQVEISSAVFGANPAKSISRRTRNNAGSILRGLTCCRKK